jgi:hypothetical protein
MISRWVSGSGKFAITSASIWSQACRGVIGVSSSSNFTLLNAILGVALEVGGTETDL